MGRLAKDLGAVRPASRPPQRNFGTPIFAVPSAHNSPAESGSSSWAPFSKRPSYASPSSLAAWP